MTPYSQKDKRWGKEVIPNAKGTMATKGCLITCLASISDILPLQVLNKLKLARAFNLEGMIIHSIAAKALNLTYNGFSSVPSGQCIGCTNKYAKQGVPQHFFVWLDKNNEIMDPLKGLVVKNTYPIQSYRLYGTKS